MAGVIRKQDPTYSQQRLFVKTLDEIIKTLHRPQLTLILFYACFHTVNLLPWSQRSAIKKNKSLKE